MIRSPPYAARASAREPMGRSAIGLVLLLAACDPGDVVLLAPETSGPKSPSLAVRAVIDTPYAAIAESLGWTADVPGATVRVHVMTEPYAESYWHVATADSTGLATFADLLSGLYEVEVTRTLSLDERTTAGDMVQLLAGGRRLYLPATSVQQVSMAPDQRGSLVFSELSMVEPRSGIEYPDSKYFEIYNNSDTTIYLDGKYWGMGWEFTLDFPYWPCAQTEMVRNDPQGIWAQRILRFPGAGRDYPLEPGQSALIVKSAIDHRSVDPGFDDLSHADFEWGAIATPTTPRCRTSRTSACGPCTHSGRAMPTCRSSSPNPSISARCHATWTPTAATPGCEFLVS